MVFYRKYRPQKFSDLVGQEAIVEILMSQLKSGKIGHAYLFSGPKGTGKTSSARIFAKAVNCISFGTDRRAKNLKFGEPCNKCISCTAIGDGSGLDLIEIDAASNRNIDDVREIREKIKTSPVSSRFKVYIIDEVHMLTKEAFNALLKTLEEPPQHAIFILCTTEESKLPTTIISRVARFHFKKAQSQDLKKAILKVAKAESIKIEDEALELIIKYAEGGYRDAISLLDQLSSKNSKIGKEDVDVLAVSSQSEKISAFLSNIIDGDIKSAVAIVEDVWQKGGDVGIFTTESILFLQKALFVKLAIVTSQEMDSSDEKAKVVEISKKTSSSYLQNLIRLLLVSEGEMKLYPLPHISLILALCKLMPQERQNDHDTGSSLENTKDLESEIKLKTKDVEKKEKAAEPTLKLKTVGTKNKAVRVVAENWPKFIDEVRQINSHIAAILRSTKPINVEDDILLLGVYFRFHKDKLEEPKTLRILEEILTNMSGYSLRMKFVVEEKSKDSPITVKKSDLEEVEGTELEAMAAEIFSK